MEYVSWYQGARVQTWQTPPEFFQRLHDRFRFDLDGAGSDGNGLLPSVSTIERPVSWTGRRVFCNPPWSDIRTFVELAVHAECAVLLVPSRVNARWFHRALALGARVEYFQGKLKFHQGGESKWNSPVDCLLLVFGEVSPGNT